MTARAEYLRGIMDAVGDVRIRRVVVIKGSQLGWTECLNNTAAYFIAEDPAPILVIQPTLEMAEAWSKDRFAPMLRDTPALDGKVNDPKSRDSANTIRQKTFRGGRISMIGANSPAGLAARPIRVVLADEVDRYPLSAGTEHDRSEGDPLALAAKRQLTFWNRKTLIGGTPTVKGLSVIEREWELSDQRHFHVPCPECGEAAPLTWANVRWEKAADGTHRPETTHYVCTSCGAMWDDAARWSAIKHGKWIASRPDVKGTAGFHVPGLLSSWLTLEDVVREFLAAKTDPQLLQVWVNTVLGETWEEPSEKVEGSGLIARGESYGPDSIPDQVLVLFAGVDVQGDRLEVQIIGFGLNEEMWGIAHEVIIGDPAQKATWDELDGMLLTPLHREDGHELRIRACCVDMGGHHGAHVLSFCNARMKRRVFAIKGAAGPRPIWPRRASKTKTNFQFFLVGVDTGKDLIHSRLRIDKPGPGYWHFPAGEGFDEAYFDQLTSERVATRRKEGKPYRVWFLPPGKRNEALDCAVYAIAARHSIPIRLNALPEAAPPPVAAEVETEEDAAAAVIGRLARPSAPVQPPRSGPFRPQRGGWMSGRGNRWFDR